MSRAGSAGSSARCGSGSSSTSRTDRCISSNCLCPIGEIAPGARQPHHVEMSDSPILATVPLAFQWPTLDPFLFCVHHDDAYPAGNDQLGPAASLTGRELGMDFAGKDGWRMHHGEAVPGFPQHPHRGFETVTVVRQGLIDHSDSLGATARFGCGVVLWLTTGAGVVHSELFPLVRQDAPNPLHLFQIWLNLPAADKLVDPYFTMLWNNQIPRAVTHDDAGRATEVTVVAGHYAPAKTAVPKPPPNSWAARAEADVAIWTIKMAAGATWTLPAAKAGTNRTLYFFQGAKLRAGGRDIAPSHGLELRGDAEVSLEAGPDEIEMLLLQGRPIGEPVVQYGPFVMNTVTEIRQAFADFQRTRFVCCPWQSDEPDHPRDQGRFARHVDCNTEQPA